MNVMNIFETMEYGPAPEAATPALDWLKAHQPFGLFINNQWVKPSSGKYLESVNPASGVSLARIAAGNSADVDMAVAAGRPGFSSWGGTPGPVPAPLPHAFGRYNPKQHPPPPVLAKFDK